MRRRSSHSSISHSSSTHNRASHRGFTLVELLIVVVVIGILATLAIPKFANTKQRAARTAGVSDIHNLATQEERFFSENGRYGDLPDTAALKFTPSPHNTALGIALTGAPAGTSGYNAIITIPGGQHCGVFVGTAPRPGSMPTSIPDGTPSCW
jgi:prepilin-type N-terminal cleavage/methylation domain-containing protein